MPMTPRKIVLFISLALAASLQSAHARSTTWYTPYGYQLYKTLTDAWSYTPETKASPVDNYFTRQATTHNGVQLAKVLDPALIQLLQSNQLTAEQIKALEKFGAQLAAQPGGIGAALEQLAASQNANLAAATQGTTQQLVNRLRLILLDQPEDNDDGHFWVTNLASEGDLAGQRGSAGLGTANQGLMVGADWAVDYAWRIGVLGASSNSRLDARRFAANLDSWHLGAYAVRQEDPFALRLGAIYSNHTGKNQRSVEFLSHKQTIKGRYDATSQNVFAEAGYQLGGDGYSIEPFAGLGYQRYHRGGFKEHGGSDALNVQAQTQQNLSSSFGLNLAKRYEFDNQMELVPYLSAGWKHLYGDVDSSVRQSFRYHAIDSFTVQGTALDRNSLTLVTGLDLQLSANHTVGLAYTSEKGTHSRHQGLTGEWRMTF
ncbi:autotransporter domain-containing protein [Pseudomonas sp. KBW05]|uniref:autotransporter outer membrane beta-barrel domain-containing protein n=1 Tax=Pseudomonas sp. KBW05 TaxID=2153360 RepID=UPI000F5B8460|nr:autotransporter outer membrane beta-barrel domain-containing protein [Pseudomonas sp. KBW05]RQO54114.1 autotransporter outer membrane beta-barrel domain-containing protein [Pseudomonas sp. KBW05]